MPLRLMVEPQGHERQGLDHAEPLLETPAEQLLVSRGALNDEAMTAGSGRCPAVADGGPRPDVGAGSPRGGCS